MTKSQTKTVRKAQHPIKSPYSFCSHFLPTWQVKVFWLLGCFLSPLKACCSQGLHYLRLLSLSTSEAPGEHSQPCAQLSALSSS